MMVPVIVNDTTYQSRDYGTTYLSRDTDDTTYYAKSDNYEDYDGDEGKSSSQDSIYTFHQNSSSSNPSIKFFGIEFNI